VADRFDGHQYGTLNALIVVLLSFKKEKDKEKTYDYKDSYSR
jgi:hypothetical protein